MTTINAAFVNECKQNLCNNKTEVSTSTGGRVTFSGLRRINCRRMHATLRKYEKAAKYKFECDGTCIMECYDKYTGMLSSVPAVANVKPQNVTGEVVQVGERVGNGSTYMYKFKLSENSKGILKGSLIDSLLAYPFCLNVHISYGVIVCVYADETNNVFGGLKYVIETGDHVKIPRRPRAVVRTKPRRKAWASYNLFGLRAATRRRKGARR